MKQLRSRPKALLRESITRLASVLVADTPPPASDVVGQHNLLFQYRLMLASGQELPSFDDVGFGVYSGGNEDGIILLLLAAAGMGNRSCVEIGAGNPRGANTTNLIINWGYRGLLIEADEAQAEVSSAFFARQRRLDRSHVTVCRAWVTVENVNDLVRDNNFDGEVGLLSLDIDGVDYWIWEALDVARPRLLVVEVQDIWGPDDAVTVPYTAEFGEGPASQYNYCGASLAAWVGLNRRKGYRLVGATPDCLNAFFVRGDVAPDVLPEVSSASCMDQPWLQADRDRRLVLAKSRSWVSV